MNGAPLAEIAEFLRNRPKERRGLPLNEQERVQRQAIIDGAINKRFCERWATLANDPRAQCVYVFPAREYVKVGVTNDLQNRWKQIRTGNPCLEPVLYATCKLFNPSEVEMCIHRLLSAYRVEGTEWFRCNRYLAVEVVKQAEEQSNEYAKKQALRGQPQASGEV